MALLNVIAGAKPQQFLPLQISVWKIFHIFQTGAGVGEGGLADQFLQMVIFAGIPFRIHQQPQPVLKGHVPELRV